MAKTISNSNLLVISNDIVNIWSLKDEKLLSSIDFRTEMTVQLSDKEKCYVGAMCISPCGQFIAIAAYKTLILYDINVGVIVSKTEAEKSVACIRFFNQTKTLLIADKSGTVTFYDFEKSLQKKHLVLGHTSMLTDVLISDDDKFVITADRDEKIRITCYPNVYNIYGYCLGHEDFVSSLSFLPHSRDVIISSSGDATLRFWNIVEGKELYKYQDALCKTPIVKVVVCLAANGSQLAIQFYEEHEIVLISVSGDSKNINVNLTSRISLTASVVDMTFCNDVLVYFLEDQKNPISTWPSGRYKVVCEAMSKNIKFEGLANFKKLFKNEFSCVEEYYQKKRARLEARAKKSI